MHGDVPTANSLISSKHDRLSIKAFISAEIQDARLGLMRLLLDLDNRFSSKVHHRSNGRLDVSRRTVVKYLPVLEEDTAFGGGYENVLYQISNVSFEEHLIHVFPICHLICF